MSVLTCTVTPGEGFCMAADSGGSRDEMIIAQSPIPKLVDLGGLVVSSCGRSSEHLLMQDFVKRHGVLEEASTSGILDFMLKFATWKESHLGVEIHNDYMFGVAFRVFTFRSCAACEVQEFEAFGAGTHFAYTALHLGKTAEEAARVAIELCPDCAGDVRVISKHRSAQP